MRSLIGTAAILIVGAGAARAGDVDVSGDITVSTTWTANNVYNLGNEVHYVVPGVTLTIDPGVLVKTTAGTGAALVVTRGANIFVNGTSTNPVIMTSTNDDLVNWRAAANEWGGLVIMGEGFISENATVGNLPTCNASNVATMEGLTAPGLHPEYVLYGGGDDDDDSGSISYLSVRYCGDILLSSVELNGIGLGGVGRDTDVQFVEVMNNVDDGIEIWGGTVNVKYFNIWNVGDDSFDCDQGWRGKAEFGLIVQGYSLDANQGSGVGDNIFETDGAENSFWQPVTTATIYNVTAIGQPVSGDHATAWRDNARVQYRNCVFMDVGERVVSFDNVDGDGGAGYGASGTLTWADTWTTSYTVTSTVNPCPSPATTYQAQSNGAGLNGGKLAEITDSVFFRNQHGTAYTEATNRDVFNVANHNVLILGTEDCDAPIKSINRGPAISLFGGTFTMFPVIDLDPRAANAALTSVGSAPNDGFFTPAAYRGAFDGTTNWARGWTAADAYGFFADVTTNSFCDASDLSLASCPCANPGNPDSGCDSPVPIMQGGGTTGGIKLNVIAQTSTPANSATVTGTGYPSASTPGAVLIRADSLDSASPVVFGDGIRCIGTPLVRLAGAIAAGGTSTHIVGHSAMAGAGCFYYQIWYRSQPASYCDPVADYNLSQGQTLTWPAP